MSAKSQNRLRIVYTAEDLSAVAYYHNLITLRYYERMPRGWQRPGGVGVNVDDDICSGSGAEMRALTDWNTLHSIIRSGIENSKLESELLMFK